MKQNLSLKFAKTLYKIALKTSVAETFFEQLKSLQELFNDKEFQQLVKRLENVQFEVIKTVVPGVFKKSLEAPLENMLILLIANKNIRILPDIYNITKLGTTEEEVLKSFNKTTSFYSTISL